MNLDRLVKRDYLPWQPNPQVSGLDVWHEYETPLSGTFRMPGVTILFTLVLELDHGSAWAYVELPADVASSLEEKVFSSVQQLNAWIDSTFEAREAVIALARNDRVFTWTRRVVDPSLLGAVDSFLTGIISSVDDEPDMTTRVRAKMAGLDAARSELVQA